MSGPGDQSSSETITRALARVLADGEIAVLATVIAAATDDASTGLKVLIETSGRRTGTTGDAELDESLTHHAQTFIASRAEARTFRVDELASTSEKWRTARFLFERVEPEPHVVVCGAGHVGASLARLANAVGYRVTLVDDRADFVTRDRFPEGGIELIAATTWSSSVREAIGTGKGVSVAVVTRGHSEDEECMRAVLEARPDYVGMIGSKRRTNIVLSRLRQSGFAEELLREVRAPIGLDIGAVAPEEVALAVLAEIVAHRRGGAGSPLSAWRRA